MQCILEAKQLLRTLMHNRSGHYQYKPDNMERCNENYRVQSQDGAKGRIQSQESLERSSADFPGSTTVTLPILRLAGNVSILQMAIYHRKSLYLIITNDRDRKEVSDTYYSSDECIASAARLINPSGLSGRNRITRSSAMNIIWQFIWMFVS